MRYKPVCLPIKKRPKRPRRYGKKRVYKTTRRRGGIYGKVIQMAYGISTSYSKDIRRPSKIGRSYRMVARDQYIINNSLRQDVAVGVQSTNVIAVWDKTDVASIKSNLTTNSTSRIYLDQCNSQFRFTNQGTTALWMTLYHISARRDNSSFAQPTNAWQTGIQDESGGASAFTHFGSIPTNSVSFNNYYKIHKIFKVALPAGGTHQHSIQVHPKKIINYEEFNNVTYGVRGITSYLMWTMSTSAYNDSTTKSSVSLAAGHLDIVYAKTYKYGYISDNQTSYYESNNLPASFAVNQDVMTLGPAVITGDTNA